MGKCEHWDLRAARPSLWVDDYDDDDIWPGHMLRLSMAFSCMTHNDDFVLFSRPSKLG